MIIRCYFWEVKVSSKRFFVVRVFFIVNINLLLIIVNIEFFVIFEIFVCLLINVMVF